MLFRALLFSALLPGLLAALLPICAVAQGVSDAPDRFIRILGLPPIPIPPSVVAPRQGDRIDTPRLQIPEGPQTGLVLTDPPPAQSVPKAAPDAVAPAAPQPLSPEKRLAGLYARLAKAADPVEAQGIVASLERQWLFTLSDTAGLIMTRALEAMQTQNLPLAEELLDKLLMLEPQWAEGWNKRATIRFMRNNYDGSMEDIAHVLKLDPRHFGALMGLGTILQRSGNDKRALEAYRRVHEIYPALETVTKIIETMAPNVDGRDI